MASAGKQRADEMYTQAATLHAAGKLADAQALYESIITKDPKHADTLHMLGALTLQRYKNAKADRAKQLITQAIHLAPGVAKYRRSLGIVYQEMERWSDALTAFEHANDKEPNNVQTLMGLARSLRELDRPLAAAEVYASITRLDPSHPTAHYKRGALLRSVKGRSADALTSFEAHLKLKPNHATTKFWIAAITGDVAGMAAAPAQMVADLFDQYADHFEDHLITKLQYRTPEALRDELEVLYARRASSQHAGASSSSSSSSLSQGAWAGRCVDLGCGTGLMGPLLRQHVSRMEGVDLSGGMVEQARKRGIYDHLAVAELVQYLQDIQQGLHEAQQPTIPAPSYDRQAYTLLVAADVFVYIGDLQPVMAAAALVSQPGCVFAFSVEALSVSQAASSTSAESSASSCSTGVCSTTGTTNGTSTAGGGPPGSTADGKMQSVFKLQATGRYAHSEGYLHDLAERTGWHVESIRHSIIRMNAGSPIHGFLCVFTLPS